MWVGVAVMAAGCLVVVALGRRSTAGTLPRNELAGLRTRATLADDEAWQAAHRAAGGLLTGAGLVGSALSAGAAVTAALNLPGPTAALVLSAAGVLTALTVAACVKGDRAARRHLAARD